MGRNDKCRYQRNCAFSNKKKKGQHGIILPKVIKDTFIIRKNGSRSMSIKEGHIL